MIAQVKGHLVQKNPGWIIVETNGLGYQIFVSLHTFCELPDCGQAVKLHTYTHVREDLLHLYGFSTTLEKDLFQILIGVSGIGPRLALNILSGISPEELVRSLGCGDTARLVSIPGVGRKTAERMLLDLKEKARRLEAQGPMPAAERLRGEGLAEDVVSALVNLGYKKPQAEKAVGEVLGASSETSLEKALKESLKILSAG